MAKTPTGRTWALPIQVNGRRYSDPAQFVPVPTPARPTAIGQTTTTATINAASPGGAAVSMRVYRNGSLLTSTTSGVAFGNFTDVGPLQPATAYDYRVSALSATGEESALSEARSVTTTALPTSPTTLAQDWINRSTAPGVVQAKRFTSLADVGNKTTAPYWPAPGDVAANMIIVADGGVIGDGCVRFVIPKTQGQRPNSLLFPLNAAWNSNLQGFNGGRFWIQFRSRIGPMLLADEATKGTALKLCNVANYNYNSFVSSRSNTEYELVVYAPHVGTVGGASNLNAYRRNDPAAGGGLAGGGADTEGAYDMWRNDVTLAQAEQPFGLTEEDWYTYLLEIEIDQYGVKNGQIPGNYFSLKCAGPGDTAWTEVFRSQAFGIGTESDAGFTGFWFTTGYDTGRSGSAYDSYVEVDQLIVSTQPIALPVPYRNVPSWAKNAPLNTWSDVPGTATGTIAATGTAQAAAAVDAWTGFLFDYENRRIRIRSAGGHGDRNVTDGIDLDLSQESCAWVQLFAGTSAGGYVEANNAEGRFSDGTRADDHNYNLCVWANGKGWYPAFGAMSGSVGYSSSAGYYWDPSLLPSTANSSRGWVYLGKHDPTFPTDGVRWVEAGCDYDPIGRKVWALKQNWGGSPALVSIDVDAPYTIRTYTPSGGNGNSVQQIIIHPAKRLLLAIGSNVTLRMNLDAPGTFTACTETGRPTLPKGFGAAFSRASNGRHGAVLCWPISGTSLYKLAIPPSQNGTYAWSTLTNSGSAPTVSSTVAANGIWKKFGLIPMGDGHEYLFVCGSASAAVKFLKLPKEGR